MLIKVNITCATAKDQFVQLVRIHRAIACTEMILEYRKSFNRYFSK